MAQRSILDLNYNSDGQLKSQTRSMCMQKRITPIEFALTDDSSRTSCRLNRDQHTARNNKIDSVVSSTHMSTKETPVTCISALEAVDKFGHKWQNIAAEGLNLDYSIVLPRLLADKVLKQLEADIEYLSGDLARVFVFGKWHDIPRQQVAFGDEDLTYTFSGNTVPAQPWPPVVRQLRDMVQRITGVPFNFVLVNRYRSGSDHIGEHRDDEKDLDRDAPIASLSLGQRREFVLRHRDARDTKTPAAARRNIPSVKVMLEHGSLLLMNPPTNRLWYHSLPARKSAIGVRINLTFRRIVKPSFIRQ